MEEMDQAYDPSELKDYDDDDNNNNFLFRVFWKLNLLKSFCNTKSFFCTSLVEVVFLLRWKSFYWFFFASS